MNEAQKVRKRLRKRLWASQNRERINKRDRELYRKHRKNRLKARQEAYAKNPEKFRERKRQEYKRRRVVLLARIRQWDSENREYRNRYQREYNKRRRMTDALFVLAKRSRGRIAQAILGVKLGTRKADTSIRLLGCSFLELRKFIEVQFTAGMTWDAFLEGRIHLDHKRPVVSFDLRDPAQQKECFHYTNLQPLWAVDNLKKGGRLVI